MVQGSIQSFSRWSALKDPYFLTHFGALFSLCIFVQQSKAPHAVALTLRYKNKIKNGKCREMRGQHDAAHTSFDSLGPVICNLIECVSGGWPNHAYAPLNRSQCGFQFRLQTFLIMPAVGNSLAAFLLSPLFLAHMPRLLPFSPFAPFATTAHSGLFM